MQRLLREGHGKLEAETGVSIATASPAAPGGAQGGERATLENVLAELVEIRALLRGTKKR